jgi:hypothetical protein
VPPNRDLTREPYGQLWRESYGPPARELGLTIAGCSNVGPVIAGDWNGWHCIGASMVVGPNGEPVLQAACGADEDLLAIVELPS